MINKTCETCGKQFEIPNCVKNVRKYCSKLCYYRSLEKSPIVERICKQCNKQFTIRLGMIGNGGHIGNYCSKQCVIMSRKNRRGADTPHWKGGSRKDYRGYVYIRNPDHPLQANGYIQEHRLVMEKHIGRYLTIGEEIHHINHKKDDNRIENLMLCSSKSVHMTHHKNNCKKLSI